MWLSVSVDRASVMSRSLLFVLLACTTYASASQGICAQPLGYSVNSFLDKCFASHHFFAAMRAYSLKDLYKIYCCPGYKEVSRVGRELVCAPECKDGCYRGTCIKPDTCQCETGYILRNTNKCEPLCQPSCINSHCSGVDRCTCFLGYTPVLGAPNECQPSCVPRCVNGTCKSPGICECFEGYGFQQGSDWVCQPVCNPPCNGGVCVSPGVCRCFPGYTEKTGNECQPVCPSGCGVGNCTGPSMCSCPEDYEAVWGEPCRPKCESCVGGTCVSPGTCLCPLGRTFETTIGKCVTICESPCLNGNCEEDGKCHCLEGYSLNEETGSCEAVCKDGCRNGRCVKPNQCECAEGYAVESPSGCRAVCRDECGNGTCTAPDVCSCWEGYYSTSDHSCSPVCPLGCGIGECASPDNCTCPWGYEVSVEGPCRPICSPPCENGFCVEPNVCTCSKDFILDEKSGSCVLMDVDCVPKCKGCLNGVCTDEGECECLQGYNKRPQDQSLCLPELGRTSKELPMSSLNKFLFPSALRKFPDNSLTFATTLQINLNKNCGFLFQNDNDTGDCSAIQVDCVTLPSQSDTDIKVYCEWPEASGCLTDRAENMTSMDEESAGTWQVHDLSLSLEFPESLAAGGDGYCTICLKSINSSKDFDFSNGLETLLAAPCPVQQIIASSLEGGGGWELWIVIVGVLLATAILLVWAAIHLLLKTSSNINPETIEIGQVDREKEKMKVKEIEENLYSEPLLPTLHPSTNL